VRAALALVLVLGACRSADPPVTADPKLIAISPIVTVRTDSIDGSTTSATFALVDADNRGATELMVTLHGDLVDGAGAVVGPLRRESLRIPAGGRRTFALVDDALKGHPEATGAKVSVDGAYVPTTAARMRIADGNAYADNGRAVAAGNLVNDSDAPGKAVVIASFHDADGKPMTRPFDVVDIGAHVTRSVRFVGPPGSRSAQIFVGDVTY